MKNYLLAITFVWIAAGMVGSHGFAQDSDREFGQVEGDRRAQSGMKFLSLSPSPRSSALAGAVTASGSPSSTALFSNPAHMGLMEHTFDASIGYVDWIADIGYNAGSIAFRPGNGGYGVFGISVMSVDYGEYIGTRRAGDTEDGYVDTGTISPSAMSVGVGYARRLTDRFSVGGQAKYARQDLGESTMRHFSEHAYSATQGNAVQAVAFDFGVLYRTGFESLNFGIGARNFSTEVRYEEFAFELPLDFNIGLSMNVLDLSQADPEMHSLILSVEGRRPRDYDEQMKIGGEYTFMNLLDLRAGYVYPSDEAGLSLGAGLQTEMLGGEIGVDYSYSQMGTFSNVNRLALRVGL